VTHGFWVKPGMTESVAGMTIPLTLPSPLRGRGERWIPASAGMTEGDDPWIPSQARNDGGRNDEERGYSMKKA